MGEHFLVSISDIETGGTQLFAKICQLDHLLLTDAAGCWLLKVPSTIINWPREETRFRSAPTMPNHSNGRRIRINGISYCNESLGKCTKSFCFCSTII